MGILNLGILSLGILSLGILSLGILSHGDSKSGDSTGACLPTQAGFHHIIIIVDENRVNLFEKLF